jgi:hypothetical protein
MKQKKNIRNKMNRRIMYLRDEHYRPVGCIALSINKDRNRIRYQVSVLNPVDNFERSLARHIALGRLVEKPFVIRGLNGDENNHEISTYVMNDIVKNSKLPSRAKKAAALWLHVNEYINVDPDDSDFIYSNKLGEIY